MASNWTAMVVVALALALAVISTASVAVPDAETVSGTDISFELIRMDCPPSSKLVEIGCGLVREYARDHFAFNQVAQFEEKCSQLDYIDMLSLWEKSVVFGQEQTDIDVIKSILRANHSSEEKQACQKANSYAIIKLVKLAIGEQLKERAPSEYLDFDYCKRKAEFAASYLTDNELCRFDKNCRYLFSHNLKVDEDDFITITIETGIRKLIESLLEFEPVREDAHEVDMEEIVPKSEMAKLVGLHRLENV